MAESEFNTETLICTEHQRHGKYWIYKYKYFGNAHGIINIFIPSSVIEVFLVIEENVEKCKIENSIVDPSHKKFVISSKLPIDLNDIPQNKISFIAKSYAHNINTPIFTIICEYIRNICRAEADVYLSPSSSPSSPSSKINIIPQSLNTPPSNTKYLLNSTHTKNTYTKSINIPNNNKYNYNNVANSIPISSIQFGQSPLNGSKNINDIIEDIKNS
jgi:hypothetical protein